MVRRKPDQPNRFRRPCIVVVTFESGSLQTANNPHQLGFFVSITKSNCSFLKITESLHVFINLLATNKMTPLWMSQVDLGLSWDLAKFYFDDISRKLREWHTYATLLVAWRILSVECNTMLQKHFTNYHDSPKRCILSECHVIVCFILNNRSFYSRFMST